MKHAINLDYYDIGHYYLLEKEHVIPSTYKFIREQIIEYPVRKTFNLILKVR